ncbi:TonB-dependent receptor [Novosphingobium sp.]|uniref:TonB-dependent receptor n=1 Tax=Novosphingobium sp. TaxID=1874826 RepID=UPI0031D71566
MKNKLILAALLGSSALLSPAVASAQDTAADNKAGLQEIVVTANRTASAAQKTSVALTVYSGADLVSKGVTNIMTLATVDPSVSVTPSNGAGYVAVRGIASTDTTEIGDPSVPIARDGFYTNRSFSMQTSMYDLARVEVLKGPQGTLQGRNSTGGLISLITNRPTDKDGGYARMGVGNYGAFNSELGVNLALTDTFQVRASGIYTYHNGYRTVTGLYTGQPERGDDQNVASGRVQFAWQPVDNLKLWASYQHDSVVGVGDVSMNLPIRTVPTITNASTFTNVAPTRNNVQGDRVRWEASYAGLPGNVSMIYSGGWDRQIWTHALDATMAGYNDPTSTGYPAVRQFLQSEHPTTWNHEVRFANDSGSRLFVQAGWFHFQEVNNLDSGIYNVAMTGLFAPGAPLAALGQAGQYAIHFNYNVLTKSDAVFGQGVYRLGDKVKLSVGARYTWDKKIRTGGAALNLAALVSPFIPAPVMVTPGNGQLSTGQATFHGGIDYNPTNSNLLYAKVDTGYKPGGFNSNGSAPPVNYGAEKVTTFEIGSKNRFLGSRLQINLSAFYSDYRGYQASQMTGALSSGSGVFNVGSAKIFGGEAQLIALIGDGFRFDFNGAALHTKLGQNIFVADGETPPVTFNISGHRLPNAPSLSFSTGLEKAQKIGFGTVTARVEGKYSSAFYYDVLNNADTRSASYMTGGASLRFEPDQGGWQIEAYVRNLTNKIVFANAQRNYNSNYNTYEFQPPRTYGVTGSVKF